MNNYSLYTCEMGDRSLFSPISLVISLDMFREHNFFDS